LLISNARSAIGQIVKDQMKNEYSETVVGTK